MPTFRYQPLSGSSGAVIDAPDRAAAVRLLRAQGITPAKVEQIGANTDRPRDAPSRDTRTGQAGTSAVTASARRRAMSRAEMASFVRELATAVQAGLPLVQALRTIARQSRSPRQQAMLTHLITQVESGKSLSEAAAGWGRPFTELTINLVRAGEMSGKLTDVLEQCATLLDRDLKLRRTMLSGLLYPAILAVLITIAITIIVTFIVPTILAPFAGQLKTSQLPTPTRIVMGVAGFLGSYWWLVAGLSAGLVLLVSSLYRTPSSRLSIDRGLLKVPLLGRVLRDVAVARFTRTLGTLVAAGLPALTGLKITKATLGNTAMEHVIDEVCEQVASGKTISEPMERSGYFPPLLTQIVGLGERSGRLPQMLHQAAGVFEDRTETSIKIFTTAFPPLLIVVAAVIVAFVLAAVMLPLIQMQELIGS